MIYLLFLDAQSTSASCVFNCKRNEELKRVSKDRLKSIINASTQREDDLLAQLPIVDSYDDNCPLYCHRNCVSTYTSKNHIDRHLNQKRKSTVPEEKTSKRTRSSSDKSFLFKQDCLFCGKECLERDNKNPGRWRIYYIVRTVNRPDKTAFTDFILKVCDLRRDSWAEEVEFRVKSAISDLHASDARYHEDCRKSFCRSVYLDTLRASSSKEEDQALKHVIQLMKDNQESSWNSVEIENLYREYGGYELNRANLVKTLSIHICDDLLVLSAPGVASILLFNVKCHLSILSDENDADKSVKDLGLYQTKL